MKHRSVIGWLAVVTTCLLACGRAAPPQPSPTSSGPSSVAERAESAAQAPGGGAATSPSEDADRVGRKVVRHAELTLESIDPRAALARVMEVAQRAGGYVVSSASHDSSDHAGTDVSIVVRVPAADLTSVIERLREGGGRIIDERITSEDVTAEFIDTSAAAVAQKALEAQYLELLKQVKSVKDALEVQAQLAAVRTEVEKLVGRRRFLNDQSALSDDGDRNYWPRPLVAGLDLRKGLELAGSDVLNVGGALLLGLIRALGWLVPLALFGAPFVVLGRKIVRRLVRRRGLAGAPG